MAYCVIRYRSLGDVVLAAAFTRALAPVTFVTHARYSALAARFPGVERVLGPDDALPPGARVIDLQNSLRSRGLRADVRVARDDLARRLRPAFKLAPARSVVARYGEACGVAAAPLPWLAPARRGEVLLVVPGAAHATKRWQGWGALACAWDGPVRVLGGPGEDALVAEVASACAGDVVCESGFDATLAAMDGGAVLVAGDTGLLHLGAAVGLPVVGVFGPTTSVDGFFAYADGVRQRAVELPLGCRPCSRHGGDHCPMGDHACLRDLDVATVLSACRAAAAS